MGFEMNRAEKTATPYSASVCTVVRLDLMPSSVRATPAGSEANG